MNWQSPSEPPKHKKKVLIVIKDFLQDNPEFCIGAYNPDKKQWWTSFGFPGIDRIEVLKWCEIENPIDIHNIN